MDLFVAESVLPVVHAEESSASLDGLYEGSIVLQPGQIQVEIGRRYLERGGVRSFPVQCHAVTADTMLFIEQVTSRNAGLGRVSKPSRRGSMS